ncbi:MAG: LpxL/LpxP family acyltransferase [Limisphaerales bacterium]
MATTWTKAPERGSTWAMRLLFWALNFLGYNVAKAFLVPIVVYFVLTGRRSRRASRDYFSKLRRVDSEAPASTLLQVYHHHLDFAQTLLERALLWQGKMEGFRFTGTGKELLEQQGKGGCILLGAHFGSFDALRILASEMKCRVNVVMYRAHAQRINQFLEELNPETNLRVVELIPGDMEGILSLKQCIERGEHVAMLADRLAPTVKQRISKVNFLGAEAPFPEGPWHIASIFGCPVLFVAAARVGAKSYQVTVEPIAERIERREEILTGHIQNFAHRLETLCRRHPTQWFNFYDFWSSVASQR